MEIIFSPESLDDLINIYSYISSVLYEPEIAKNQVNRIREAIRNLDLLPMRHRIVDWEPWRSMEMRVFPVNNYEIYYLVDQNRSVVQIVRIFYSGRDVENIINKNV